MTNNEKFQIKRRTARRNFWSGLCSTPDLPVKLLGVLLYLAGAVFVLGKQEAIRAYGESISLLSPVLLAAMTNTVPVYLFVGGIALAVLLGYPFGKRAAKDQLQSIGLVNHAGMVPELLHKKKDKEHPNVTVWEFRNQGIPLEVWEDRRGAIEAALDITIVKLSYGRSKSQVLLHAVPARCDLPAVLPWEDKYLSPDSFVLSLGESQLGPVTVNLAHIPHILLGGSTGSGKSVLLKLLLMQALRKGAVVCIADFKGGVDFPPVWHQKCRMCFTEADLLYTLNQLVAVLELSLIHI